MGPFSRPGKGAGDAEEAFCCRAITHKPREAEVELARGQITGEVRRKLEISEQTYCRWRRAHEVAVLAEVIAQRLVPCRKEPDSEGGVDHPLEAPRSWGSFPAASIAFGALAAIARTPRPCSPQRSNASSAPSAMTVAASWAPASKQRWASRAFVSAIALQSGPFRRERFGAEFV